MRPLIQIRFQRLASEGVVHLALDSRLDLEPAPLVEIIDRVVISNMIVNNLDFLSQLLSGGSLLQYLDVILLQFAMLLL